MTDVTGHKTRRQAKKHTRPFRWKGFQRQNVEFLYLEHGLTSRKVADLLEIPLGSVRTHINRRMKSAKHRPTPWNK